MLGPRTADCGPEQIYHGYYITGPSDICHNLHLRRMLAPHVDWGTPMPIDVFVLAEGECKRRHNTKIGGLPYRPRNLAWPIGKRKEPLTFLAQFCFADSRDIAGDLPGDVLLLFTDCEESWPEEFLFEWYSLDLADLIRPEDVPKQNWLFKPCHGHICRVDAYPNARVTSPVNEHDWLEIVPQRYICVGDMSFSCVRSFPATQIGPWHSAAQFDHPPKGRPLCVLNQVCADPTGPFPFVNREKPFFSSLDDYFRDGYPFRKSYFDYSDMGAIFLSIDDLGQVHGTMGNG